MRVTHFYQLLHRQTKLINEGNLEEFLQFAKDWNIFKNDDSNYHKIITDKIKERLKKENLPEIIVKPENINV